jgi:hypothetical protein
MGRLSSTAMGMPQNEAFENQNLWTETGKGASHSCYRGVANLIHFMAEGPNKCRRVNRGAPNSVFAECAGEARSCDQVILMLLTTGTTGRFSVSRHP